MARRQWLQLVGLCILILLFPTGAFAASDWDPDDVRGPFDLRWVGATYTASGDIRLTFSFYDPVPTWKFPRASNIGDHGVKVVRVHSEEYGRIYRTRDGWLHLIWDEISPTIPQHVPVARLSPTTFRTRFFPPHPGPYVLRTLGIWTPGDDVVVDRTDAVHLGAQPGES